MSNGVSNNKNVIINELFIGNLNSNLNSIIGPKSLISRGLATKNI